MQSIVLGQSIAPAAAPGVLRQAVPAAPPPSRERFQFTGNAAEYFGIWVVNLFLTVVTLGLYSAWAKVRRKRYFYGNTWVGGANFEYHGDPVAILKGRLLAFAAFAAYTAASYFSQKLAAAIALAFLPALPWLLVRSFAFNAVNAGHRNLRFHFRARYREALSAIAPLFILPVLWLVLPEVDEAAMARGEANWLALFLPTIVLAILYPYVVARLSLLRVSHSSFGAAPFGCDATVGAFYVIYLIALGLLAVLAMSFSLAAAPLLALGTWALGVLPVLYVLLGAILFGYTQSRVGNLVFNRSELAGRVRFASTLSARRLASIYAVNAAAIVFSLGLAIPWAAMRTARYRAECLALECEGGLEGFAADVATGVGAAGEEMGEMFDMDLSL